MQAYPEEINTLERLFKYCVKKHGYKPCLGTRAILGEEDEQQPNGKVATAFVIM
jgi:long-chain acyl-CoA synthetase